LKTLGLSKGETELNIGEKAFRECPIETFNYYRDFSYAGNGSNGDDHYALFYNKKSLKNVTIGQNVTSIPAYTFYFCENLTNANLDNAVGISAIPNGCFYYCSSLTAIKIPQNVTIIGTNAFHYCTSLKGISIPGSVTSIGKYAFVGCSSLKNLELSEGEGTLNIGENAFEDCPIETFNCNHTFLYAGNNKSEYAENALFYNSNKLQTVTIGPKVTTIPNYTFHKCKSLTNAYLFNAYLLTAVPHNCFYGCSSLNTISIPGNVTSIGYEAFYGCTNLESISISRSVTSIGSKAFYGCTNLKSISIPGNVTSIGKETFYGCSNLASASIPSSVTSIGYEAFYGCTKLKSINIPSSVTSIGNSAFYKCSSLNAISIPEKVTQINDKTFFDCSSLNTISIPSNVTSIGTEAFNGCTNLNTLELSEGEGLLDIGANAFKACPIETFVYFRNFSYAGGLFKNSVNLKRVSIGQNVTFIPAYTFSGCSELYFANLDNASRLISVPTNCFYGCTSLKSINIPSSVASIGNYAFYGCSSLTLITIPKNVTSIGRAAFNGCTQLSAVIMRYANDLETIGSEAFRSCSSLYSIVIPGSVTFIGEEAFYNSSNLAKAVIKGNPTIGTNAFPSTTNIVYNTLDDDMTLGQWLSHYYINNSPNNDIETVIIPNDNVANASVWNNSYNLNTKFPNLKTVIFNDAVTTIHSDICYGCTKLNTIVLEEGVTTIGSQAFRGAIVQQLTIPSTVTSLSTTAFYGVNTIKYLEINSNTIAQELSHSSYFGNKVVSVTYGNDVTQIGTSAFKDCTTLEKVWLGNSIDTIAAEAFLGCTKLTDLVIPASVTSIDETSFSGCNNLTTLIVNSQSCAEIVDFIPDYFPKVKYLELGGDVKRVGGSFCNDNGQYTMNGIETLVLREGVKSIGYKAFNNHKLSSLTLPKSLTSIYEGAFASTNADNLHVITIPSNVSLIQNGAFAGVPLYSATINGPVVGDNYTTDDNLYTRLGGMLTELHLGENVTEIGDYAFYGGSNIGYGDSEYFSWHDNITAIGNSAFQGCNNIDFASKGLPANVQSIGDNAFNGCNFGSNLTIPSSVNSIGEGAFFCCPNLSHITINSPTIASKDYSKIQYFASGYGKVTFGENVTEIGACLFASDPYLTEVEFLGTPSIGFATFRSCKELWNIIGSVKSVDDASFDGATSLEAITITDDEVIANTAFNGCTSLHSVSLPSNLKRIEFLAFQNIRDLQEIVIPESVTYISSDAFEGCENLTEITINSPTLASKNYKGIGQSEKNIGGFFPNVKTLTFGPNVSRIGNNAVNTEVTGDGYPTKVVFQYDGGVEIGDSAFYYSDEIVSVEGKIKDPGKCSFFYCTGLQRISFDNATTSIGEKAFFACNDMTSLTLGPNISAYGHQALYDMTSLQTVYAQSPTPAALSYSDEVFGMKGSNEEYLGNISLIVPDLDAVEDYKAADVWKDFKSIRLPGEVNLKHGTAFSNETNQEYGLITYERTFKNTNWMGLILPFSLNYEDWKDNFEIAKIYNIYVYQEVEGGDLGDAVIQLVKLKEGESTKPNVPYLIKAKSASSANPLNATLFAENTVLHKTEPKSVECSNTETSFVFTGTYAGLTEEELKGNYTLSSSGKWSYQRSGKWPLYPFNIYLHVTSKTDGYNEEVAEFASIRNAVVGEDESGEENAIFNVISDSNNTNRYSFDLYGRRIDSKQQSKGFHITNDKKILTF